MDFAGERYYKLNRILLLSLGLWPYHISIFKKVQIIFFQALSISFLICQCIPFFVKQYSINYIAKMLTTIILTCIFIVKYNAGLLLSDKIKYIFDRVRDDWNMLTTQAELEVIKKYANNAKFHTTFLILASTGGSLGLLLIMCLPHLFDVIIPMNESRPRHTIINVEYFVDEETYFFAILTHICINVYAGSITVMAIETILIAYVLHICALFRISSYRMEHIFDKNVQPMPKDIKQSVVYNNIINAVYVHRRALDLTNIWTNSFSTMYIVVLVLAVSSMSLSCFNLINAVTALEKVELVMCGSLLLLHLYFIFRANYIGQDIIDSSTGISEATYNAQWYTAPLCMQKLILLIIQRSNKRSTLLVGGLFDASLEGFSSLISMSVSYVMVLQSVGTHNESGKK
ncbi:PREDICTED: uncharacterized protein LOC105565390 [Vollenhovia emeryi]|uniref:uncharacterized protein LOC105565390 n=1 Tax=Vollenhovia emeryi TaxID=411798 RepID=UPI0005F461FB|nr:PREDICTED: uncharacterized protein LOC105565390 [Vollenhovia emeryi]XP_011873930.1 PREDICTED: uncharacterized protein LOC105565390 [Vollenhovia emeryi]XP_011873931.1 PREDICTED: uncharacterized protein LOC105565390 [Vollenhovia emeryi]